MRTFAIVFAFLVAALTAALYFLQEEVKPAPDATPPPLPSSEYVICVAFLEVGPDDEEPRIAHEVFLDAPGDATARSTRRVPLPPTVWATSSITVGAGPPSLMTPSPDDERVREETAVVRTSAKRLDDGSLRLDVSLEGPSSGSSKGLRLRPGEIAMVGGSGAASWNRWWTYHVQLARIEPRERMERGLDAWRRAVAASAASHDGVLAAGWIRCPGAAFAESPHEGEVETARLMAGDGGVDLTRINAHDDEWAWRARTIYLKYEHLRPAMREIINHHGHEEPPGPRVAALLRRDPELRIPSVLGSTAPWERIVPAAMVLLLSLVGLVSAGVRSPDVARSASVLTWGCVFALAKVQIGWLDFTELLAQPLLLAGSIGLFRAVRSWPARLAAATAIAVAALQTALLFGAPALIDRIGDIAYALLPACLFAAIDPLATWTDGLTPRRALRWYAITVLLPTLAFALLELVNLVLARPASTVNLGCLGGWIVLGLAVVGLFATTIGFWSLRKRLLALVEPA